MEVRCPDCRRLLARAVSAQRLELKCPRCGRVSLFDFSPPPKPAPGLTPSRATG